MPLQAENLNSLVGISFGPFEIVPERNLISGPEGDRTIEPKMMEVLVLLIEERGRVVSREQILSRVWKGTFVGDEVVWRSISELRKILGDDPKNPQYLETVPRKGYRWLVPAIVTKHPSPLHDQPAGQQWTGWYSNKPVIVAVSLLVLSFLLIWLLSPEAGPQIGPAKVHNPVWVLIAQAEGNAEEEYGEILRHSLEVALGQSQHVQIAAQERIADALSLMRLGPETPVTAETGKKICLRDGGIDLVVAAGVDRDQDYLLMRVHLIDPVTGSHLGGRQESSDTGGVLASVQKLSDWTRETLGEEVRPVESASQVLEKATTSSLRAIRLYSQAMKLSYLWEWGAAEQLFRRSVEEDPSFASAQIMLAWAIRNQIPPTDRLDRLSEYQEPARTAFEYSSSLPDVERLWIEASYHHLLGRTDESVAPYQALLSIHPEHLWATHNLSVHFRQRTHHTSFNGTVDAAKIYVKATADLQPKDLFRNSSAAHFLAFRTASPDAAKPYVQRALDLLDEPTVAVEPSSLWLKIYPEILLAESDEGPFPLKSALSEIKAAVSAENVMWLGDYYLDLGCLKRQRVYMRSSQRLPGGFRCLGT